MNFFNPLDPFQSLNNPYKYKSLQYLPFVGKLPYWYWMGGKEDYEEKRNEKSMEYAIMPDINPQEFGRMKEQIEHLQKSPR